MDSEEEYLSNMSSEDEMMQDFSGEDDMSEDDRKKMFLFLT